MDPLPPESSYFFINIKKIPKNYASDPADNLEYPLKLSS